MGKQLKRSSNKMIAGVAAGVAEYFDIDVTIVRIIWAVLAFACFAGIVAYLICLLLMPKE
ncbi:MAG: PspC domain-containing protein [Paludibacteraceae bacterium]|nr:PspC domain-containing protein [Paludibacteraceae bacterium]